MKRRIIPFAAAAALAAGLTFAQSPAAPSQQGAAGKAQVSRRKAAHERMMQELNLTDAQKAQSKALFQQSREKSKPYMERLRRERQELDAAVKADDTARIRDLAAKEGKTRGELTAIRSETMAKFYSSLTPEQRAKADQLHSQMRQRARQRWQERSRSMTGE
jgi:Spy/CpxP family protein refolding chaperone